MRLIAPTAFKGTMTPLEAARHLAEPGDRLLPLSDGGDAVVTGEGRLDASTLEGKLPFVVAMHCHQLGIPVIGHFGCKGEGWERVAPVFDALRFEMPADGDNP